jgi:hypothetical protein
MTEKHVQQQELLRAINELWDSRHAKIWVLQLATSEILIVWIKLNAKHKMHINGRNQPKGAVIVNS